MALDDRYLDGVYYELETGEIVTLDRDGEDVLICDEDGDELERVAFENFEPMDYYKVPEDAIEDPVTYFEDVARESVQVDGRVGMSWYAGWRYADQHTEITEVSDE